MLPQPITGDDLMVVPTLCDHNSLYDVASDTGVSPVNAGFPRNENHVELSWAIQEKLTMEKKQMYNIFKFIF